MALLDLKTDLKSLKYGRDTPGGGNSGQPYQQVDINKVDSGFNRFRMTRFDDGLVRGGTVGATNASIVDTFRIGKFLKDLPKGPLFIAKQVGLQLSNPKIETSKTGRGNVGRLGPTRIYNLGINTLAQVPVNAFGGHLYRHGLSPVQDDQTKYLKVAQENNTEKDNRLNNLRNRFGLGISYDVYQGDIAVRRGERIKLLTGKLSPSAYESIQNIRIDDYVGGPKSVYGIGRTLILRTSEQTNDKTKINYALDRKFNAKHLPEIKISSSFDYAVSTFTGSILARRDFDLLTDTGLNSEGSFLNYDVVNNYANVLSQTKDNQVNSYADANSRLRGNNFLRVSLSTSSSLAALKFNNDRTIAANASNQPSSLDNTTINTFVSPGRPNTTGSRVISSSAALGISDITGDTTIPNYNNVISYTSTDPKTKYTQLRTQVDNRAIGKTTGFSSITSRLNKSGIGANAIKQLTSLQSNRTIDKNVDEDKLAIKIVPIDAFKGTAIETLRFLAYLTNYSEAYDSGWNEVKYAGRSEKFYIFTDFKRSMNIEFNIPCFNENDLEDGHARLSKLASILSGQYQRNFLGGVISRVTVGNYLVNQPGIINNLTYAPLSDSPWDMDAKLAQYIKVTFSFTVLHDFLPEYGQPYINVTGAASDYQKSKQNQLAQEEELRARTVAANQAELRALNQRVASGNLLPGEAPGEAPDELPTVADRITAQREKLLNNINEVTSTNEQRIKKLKEDAAKEESKTKKSNVVTARKNVGKSVPKKAEQELPTNPKIGGGLLDPSGRLNSLNYYTPQSNTNTNLMVSALNNSVLKSYYNTKKQANQTPINPLTGQPFGIPFNQLGLRPGG